MNVKVIVSLVVMGILLVSIPFVVYLSSQQQDPRSRADEPAAGTCQAPAQVTGVLVDYPYCNGDQCSFTQASCEWTPVSGATSYNATITEVETSRTIAPSPASPINASTTKVTFPVTTGKTYKCDVSAVNSCGAGPVGTHSLLCQADTSTFPTSTPIPTVIPSPIPTTPIIPTSPVYPTASPAATLIPSPTTIVFVPTVTIEAPGNSTTTVLGIAGLVVAFIGGALLLSFSL